MFIRHEFSSKEIIIIDSDFECHIPAYHKFNSLEVTRNLLVDIITIYSKRNLDVAFNIFLFLKSLSNEYVDIGALDVIYYNSIPSYKAYSKDVLKHWDKYKQLKVFW